MVNFADMNGRRTPGVIPALIIVVSILLWDCSRDDTVDPALAALLAPVAPTQWDVPGDTPPDKGCVPLRSHLGHPSLATAFPDVNDIHLSHARNAGIRPVTSTASAWIYGKGLERVRSDRYIYIDSLSHSYPFLIPAAARLLETIGSRFRDSLTVRGGGAYRPKVTSVLRTTNSVSQLRRVNRNASAKSAHCYGTTFDISYSKFICDDSSDTRRTFDDLSYLLGEIIEDLRLEGRCVVKHERRQACLHITVCADNNNENRYY